LGGQWEEGTPFIATAVKKDDVRLFDFLRKQGISVNEKDIQGFTPLVLVVKEKKGDWVVRLLEAGADVHQAGVTGEALLMEVILGGHMDLAKLLIKHGATIDALNQVGETALMVVAGKSDQEAIVMLLDAGANADVLDSNGRSISDRLIESGDVEMVEFFAGKADGGITDEWMNKVFEAGNTDLLQGLLKKGGNVEAGAKEGGRLLKRAVLNKDIPMVELLLAFDADPKGEVWDALASGDRLILEQLMVSGADANEALAVGVGSPLSLALRQRRYDSAELLLLHGADPNPQQAGGQSLIEDAKSRLDIRAISILRDYCADYHEEVYFETDAETQEQKE